MKFLVIVTQRQAPPPEIMPVLVDATAQWTASAKKGGKFDVIYSIAGQPGGLGIVNVNSLEELNELVSGHPMTPFANVQTLPLSDIDHGLKTLREQVKKMSGQTGPK